MKINMLRMPEKKLLLYLLMIGLCSTGLKTQASSNGEAAIGSLFLCGLSACVAWAIYEKTSKNSLKIENIELEKTINSYKSDDNIKKYLITTSDFVGKWENFLIEVNDISKDDKKTTEQLTQDVINHIIYNFKNRNLDLDEYYKQLNACELDLSCKLNELLIKEKGYKLKPEITTNIEKFKAAINNLLSNLKQYKNLFEINKNYIRLLLFLDENIEQKYSREILYAKTENGNWDQVITRVVKSKNNQILFPYLFYVKDLTINLNALSKHLNNLSNFKGYVSQMNRIERAKSIYNSLESVANYINFSDFLAKEKANKVEYDRKEQYIKTEMAERNERSRLETKERESKITNEKAIANAQLLVQTNEEKRLANEKAKIVRDKRELEFKSQENALELARIHEGYGIKKALDDNNRKWRIDYDNLDVKYKKEIQNYDNELKSLKSKLSDYDSLSLKNRREIQQRDDELRNLKNKMSSLEFNIRNQTDRNNESQKSQNLYGDLNTKHKKELQNRDAELKNLKNKLSDFDDLNAKHKEEIRKRDNELKNLRNKLSSLESDIKGTNNNRTDFERKAKAFEAKIKNISDALNSLTNRVNNPPFNPEIVDLLPEYINNLRQEVRKLKTVIS